LYLEERTALFDDHVRLFEVSPKYSFSRRFVRMSNIEYLSGDLGVRPNVDFRMDLTAVPLRSRSMDVVICVHVLEHVKDDRSAIAEIHRILRPGGWALISVPLRLDRPTYEDASIVMPADREAAFGETSHVRFYGYDLRDRLVEAGFEVSLDRASDIDERKKEWHGLLDDENIFLCRRLATPVGS
jgi:SAM-dependent methyltransferase